MNRKWIASAALCAAMCVPALFTQTAFAQPTPAMQGQQPAMQAQQKMDSMGGQMPPADTYGKLAKLMLGEVTSAIEAMPEDKFNFAPTGPGFTGVRTFAEQVKHITGSNYAFLSGFGVPGAAMDDAKLKALNSKAEILAAWNDSVAYVQKGIATITPENAFVVVGSGELKGTRAGLASFCLAHNMDHYGQMVVYLRMNNIVPPASKK
jgi:uncharacterized damage-inducible protein DinB